LDARGNRVWGKKFPAEPNSSFTPRHDYFTIFHFSVPAELRPGRYSIVVEVTDQTWYGSGESPSHRTARHTLNFDVAADGEIAGPPHAALTIAPAGGVAR